MFNPFKRAYQILESNKQFVPIYMSFLDKLVMFAGENYIYINKAGEIAVNPTYFSSLEDAKFAIEKHKKPAPKAIIHHV